MSNWVVLSEHNILPAEGCFLAPESWNLEKRLQGVTVRVESCNALARCDYDHKRIVLDPSLFDKTIAGIYPKALESLYHEVCNWENTKDIYDLTHCSSVLNPDEFAIEFEALEYQSALKTKHAIRSVFPSHKWDWFAFSRTPESFHIQLLRQIYFGHTQRILDRYYPGEKQHIVNLPSPEELEYIEILLDLLGDLRDEHPEIAGKADSQLRLLLKCCRAEAEKGADLFIRIWGRFLEINAFFQRGFSTPYASAQVTQTQEFQRYLYD